MAPSRVNIGDCYEILLPDGNYAYCQYIAWNDLLGCLIRVFDVVSDKPISAIELMSAKIMFPPVFAGLKANVREGLWKLAGHFPVPDFKFPTFRMSSAKKPGEYDNWRLWDGKEQRFIGRLPSNLRSLEFAVVWGSGLLEERIVSGRNIYEEVR